MTHNPDQTTRWASNAATCPNCNPNNYVDVAGDRPGYLDTICGDCKRWLGTRPKDSKKTRKEK